jgi:hypothetical protein
MARGLDFTPGDVPITLYEGSVISFSLAFTLAAGGSLSVASWTFDAALYTLAGAIQATFTFSLNLTQANVGVVTVTGTSGSTPPGDYRWELWRETPNPLPVFAGAVRVLAAGGPLP